MLPFRVLDLDLQRMEGAVAGMFAQSVLADAKRFGEVLLAKVPLRFFDGAVNVVPLGANLFVETLIHRVPLRDSCVGIRPSDSEKPFQLAKGGIDFVVLIGLEGGVVQLLFLAPDSPSVFF